MFKNINNFINLNTSVSNTKKFPEYFKNENDPKKRYLFSHLDNWYNTMDGIFKNFSLQKLLKNSSLFEENFVLSYLDLKIDFLNDKNVVNKIIDFQKTIRFIDNLKNSYIKKNSNLIDYAIANDRTMDIFSHLKDKLIIKVKLDDFNNRFYILASTKPNCFFALPKEDNDDAYNVYRSCLNDTLVNSLAENISENILIEIPKYKLKVYFFHESYSNSLLIMGDDKYLFKEFKKQFNPKRHINYN